jgi:hypothetical protein
MVSVVDSETEIQFFMCLSTCLLNDQKANCNLGKGRSRKQNWKKKRGNLYYLFIIQIQYLHRYNYYQVKNIYVYAGYTTSLYPQKFVLTSPKSVVRSVGIVLSLTQVTELYIYPYCNKQTRDQLLSNDNKSVSTVAGSMPFLITFATVFISCSRWERDCPQLSNKYSHALYQWFPLT